MIDILIVCLKSKKLIALFSDGRIKKMPRNTILKLSFLLCMQNPLVVYEWFHSQGSHSK